MDLKNIPAEGSDFGEDLRGRGRFWENICTCGCGVIEPENY